MHRIQNVSLFCFNNKPRASLEPAVQFYEDHVSAEDSENQTLQQEDDEISTLLKTASKIQQIYWYIYQTKYVFATVFFSQNI